MTLSLKTFSFIDISFLQDLDCCDIYFASDTVIFTQPGLLLDVTTVNVKVYTFNEDIQIHSSNLLLNSSSFFKYNVANK